MTSGKICDGCSQPINTDTQQWIQIKITREKTGVIGKSDNSFPVKEKTLHFHADNTNTGKNWV